MCLVSENVALVDAYLRKFWQDGRKPPRGMDREDVRQEAFLGLMRAAEAFDPSRGFKFSSYAWRCIHSAIANTYNKANSDRRGPGTEHEEINEETLPGRSETPLEIAIQNEEARQRKRRAKNVLMRYFTPRRRAILRRRYYDGAAWPQIAEEFGFCDGTSAAHSTRDVIRTTLRRHPRMKMEE